MKHLMAPAGPAALVSLLLSFAAASPLTPAQIVVEDGCTLPDAITAANSDAPAGGCSAGSGADEILLTEDVLLVASVDGVNGLPVIASDVTIRGQGFEIARDEVAPDFRLLEVATAGDLVLEDVDLVNGSWPTGDGGAISTDAFPDVTLRNVTVSGSSADRGGAIYVDYHVDLLIESSRIHDNEARAGGGIFSGGADVILLNSTVDANDATETGGGLWAVTQAFGGTVQILGSTVSNNDAAAGAGLLLLGSSYAYYQDFYIKNSTISGNDALDGVGGVEISGQYGNLALINTTIAHNTTLSGPAGGLEVDITYSGFSTTSISDTVVAYNAGGDCFIDHPVVDTGGNLDVDGSCGPGFGVMTGLDPVLDFHQGETRTHALIPSSSAVDAGVVCRADVDQRGFPRSDGACDSGAFELGAGVLALVGECPGAATISAVGAAPDTTFDVYQGDGEGPSTVPAGECAGRPLRVTSPTLLASFSTDANGDGSVVVNFAGPDCGQFVQGIDRSECDGSNVEPIDSCDLLVSSHTGSGADPSFEPANSLSCPPRTFVGGEVVSLTAVPDPNFGVSGWTGTDDDASTSELISVTMPTGEHEVTVHYVELCSDLTLRKSGSGATPIATPANSPGCSGGQYLEGESIQLDAAPNVGFKVLSWEGTDDDASTSTMNTLTMPVDAHTVTVNYAPICALLRTDHTGQGTNPARSPTSSSGCDDERYVEGELIELTAAPDAGWQVASWQGTDDDSSLELVNELTMPAIGHSVSVEYEPICYSLGLGHLGQGGDPIADPQPDGTAWAENPIGGSGGFHAAVRSADLDGDGDPDVLSAIQVSSQLRWLENDAGDGTSWTLHLIDDNFEDPRTIEIADIDGDGDPDVLSAAEDDDAVTWWENLAGDASSWFRRDIGTINGAYWTVAADLDGDDDLDVVASGAHGDRMAWWENVSGDGTAWAEREIANGIDSPRGLDVTDLDGDGDADIAATVGGTDELFWWENTTGDGSTWTQHLIDAGLDFVFEVHAADVDGDSDPDLVAGALNQSSVVWFENVDGDASSWTERTIDAAASAPQALQVIDVDDDGDLDVLGALDQENLVLWWENALGDGTVWNEVLVATTSDAFHGVAADVDGDGHLDVIGGGTVANLKWWQNVYGGTCPAGSFRLGDTIELTAVPDPGWEVGGWTGTDDDVSTETANVLTMPGAAHDVSVEYILPGPTLAVGGACPGELAISISGAQPSDGVLLFAGTGAGDSTIDAGGCVGTELDLAQARRWQSLTADENGDASLNVTLGPGWCGRVLQAVDRVCAVSNTSSLDP